MSTVSSLRGEIREEKHGPIDSSVVIYWTLPFTTKSLTHLCVGHPLECQSSCRICHAMTCGYGVLLLTIPSFVRSVVYYTKKSGATSLGIIQRAPLCAVYNAGHSTEFPAPIGIVTMVSQYSQFRREIGTDKTVSQL